MTKDRRRSLIGRFLLALYLTILAVSVFHMHEHGGDFACQDCISHVHTLHYDIPLKTKIVRGLFAEIEADTNFRQDHVMTANDTETPTPAYTLVNLSVGTDIHLRNGRQLCSIGITATNLLNTGYQSHLSRLKYANTFPLTGRHGINNIGCNIGFKVLFPLDL